MLPTKVQAQAAESEFVAKTWTHVISLFDGNDCGVHGCAAMHSADG